MSLATDVLALILAVISHALLLLMNQCEYFQMMLSSGHHELDQTGSANLQIYYLLKN